MVKISVVTPSYNQTQFLEETLRSVVSQREHVHEYFVVDGGSTDGSVDLIKRYSSAIDWWVSEKDKGQSDAIRKGFARATGDVLCWLNSDDVFLPGALKRVREAFDRYPNADVVSGYLVLIDSESRILRMPRVPSGRPFLTKRGVLHVVQQSTFFKRALFEKVGGIDLSLHCCMDRDLWWRFVTAGAKWITVPEHLAGFRKHDDAKGINQQWLERYRKEGQLVDERYSPRIQRPWRSALTAYYYQLSQILSGRHIRDILETRSHRGQRLTEVFGDWQVA